MSTTKNSAAETGLQISTLTYRPERGWSDLPHELDSDRTLVLAFAAPDLEDTDAAIGQLSAAFPSSRLLGCSTAGEIDGRRAEDGSIVAVVARFSATDLGLAVAPVRDREDSHRAGILLAEQLTRPDLRGVLVLSEGHTINGSALAAGLRETLPRETTVIGGLAGDGSRFERTWVVRNGNPAEGFATAVGFYGDQVRIGHGARGGWSVFGPQRRITRSSGNVLYELDGRPALGLYRKYLGEFADSLPASGLRFPLQIQQDRTDEHPLVRTILSINEEDQSMTFAGDMPEGHLAKLMRANLDSLIDGAGDAANSCRAGVADVEGQILAVAISCVGRRLLFGPRTEEELDRSLAALPAGSVLTGFYSYGEIAPGPNGGCDLLNQTMTLMTIGEAKCTTS